MKQTSLRSELRQTDNSTEPKNTQPPAESSALTQDFLTHLAASSGQVFLVQILLCIVYTWMAYDSAPPQYLYTWLGAWLSLCFGRLYYYGRVLTRDITSLESTRRGVLTFNILFGFAQAGAVGMFPFLEFPERTIYTLLILGSVSGSVTTAGFRLMFIFFATPVLLALSFMWGVLPYPGSTVWTQGILAVLILLYLGILVADAQSFYDLFSESYNIREAQKTLNLQLNEALDIAQQASESKTRFLASASHDLRQPIHTLSLLGAALKMQDLDQQTIKIANHLGSAIDNLAAQMDSLLDISKLEAGLIRESVKTFDLVNFIDRIAAEYAIQCEAKGLELKTKCDYELALTDSDPELIERIVRNFLSNAVKYTDRGYVLIELSAQDQLWQISVIDSGRGIAPDLHKKVFEEFYQVDNPNRNRKYGLGLGLAIVKRITDNLGIPISLVSEQNKGSTFSIQLPESMALDEPGLQEVPESTASLRGRRVLCVDDEDHIREALEIVLSKLGCEVFTAASTQTAMEIAKDYKPDIVLADFRLAGDDNGIQTIQSIRQLYPELPALLISGDTAPERLQQADQAGISMLHKPVDMKRLEVVLSKFID